MALHKSGDAAVVRNGKLVTILLAPKNEETADELRSLIARLHSEGVEGVSEELRQLLDDADAALYLAFREARRVRPPTQGRYPGLPVGE